MMIEVNNSDGVALVEMKHGKVNAMNLEFLQELNRCFQDVGTDDAFKSVVLAGNARVFSAGVDLKRLVAEDLGYLDKFLPELVKAFMTVFLFPKPVIAAVTGHAVAGGCVLACAADYRVISSKAKIGVPELRVGVPFPSSGMEIMRWAASSTAFRKIINTGATFTGNEAVEVGLADEAADGPGVMKKAIQATEPFSIVPDKVFALTKQQMRQPVLVRIENSQENYGDQIEKLWRDEETRQAVSAYVSKRLS